MRDNVHDGAESVCSPSGVTFGADIDKDVVVAVAAVVVVWCGGCPGTTGEGSVIDLLVKIDCKRKMSLTDTLALTSSKSTDIMEETSLPFFVHLLRLNSTPIGSTTDKGCHNDIFLRTNTS